MRLNWFHTEPRNSPNEPHASPPGGFPSAFNKGLPCRALLIENVVPEFTRENGARGLSTRVSSSLSSLSSLISCAIAQTLTPSFPCTAAAAAAPDDDADGTRCPPAHHRHTARAGQTHVDVIGAPHTAHHLHPSNSRERKAERSPNACLGAQRQRPHRDPRGRRLPPDMQRRRPARILRLDVRAQLSSTSVITALHAAVEGNTLGCWLPPTPAHASGVYLTGQRA